MTAESADESANPYVPDVAGVGARLRSARRAVGFTIDDLSAITGLSRGFISKVERDEASPSVRSLLTLCHSLGVEIGSLFAAPNYRLVPKNAQPMVSRVVDGELSEHFISPRGLEAVQVIHTLVGPGVTTGAELFAVQSEVEILYVTSGSIEVLFANESVTVESGESLTFSGHEPHGWTNPSEIEKAEGFWIIAPAPFSKRVSIIGN